MTVRHFLETCRFQTDHMSSESQWRVAYLGAIHCCLQVRASVLPDSWCDLCVVKYNVETCDELPAFMWTSPSTHSKLIYPAVLFLCASWATCNIVQTHGLFAIAKLLVNFRLGPTLWYTFGKGPPQGLRCEFQYIFPAILGRGSGINFVAHFCQIKVG